METPATVMVVIPPADLRARIRVPQGRSLEALSEL